MKYVWIAVLMIATACSSKAQVVTVETADKKSKKQFEEAKYAYEMRKFDQAQLLLEELVEANPNFINAWFSLGQISLIRKDWTRAVSSLEQVVSLDDTYNPKTYLDLGIAKFQLNQFDQARETFKSYLSKTKSTQNIGVARRMMKNCEFAKNAINNPVPYNPLNLGAAVNSPSGEYFPALTADGEELYFTHLDRRGQFPQEDIYVSTRTEQGWTRAQRLGSEVNSQGNNEGAHCISPDGKYLIFTACDKPGGMGSCDLYIAKKVGNRWNKPRNLGKSINSPAWESQPSISSDSKSLYFVSSRNGGEGGKDIWVSHIVDGRFSKAVNLGPSINSDGTEERPFIHPDNQTLYFSSNGLPGMGGADVFMTRRTADMTWATPTNLGYPINTNGDELGLFISADGKEAYLDSERDGGFGDLDIYAFELYEDARPQLVTYVKGTVFDKVSKAKLQAKIQLINLNTGQEVTTVASDKVNGSFLLCLPAGVNYAYNVSKDGYLFYSENFELTETKGITEPFLLDIPLQKIAVGEKVILKNIFFETAKFALLEESKVELDKLKELLSKNPSMKVEIGGHTDNVGSESDNLALSENRAKEVMDYLVNNGIPAARLSHKGYGESVPIADNESEAGRAKNRRTEFKVL